MLFLVTNNNFHPPLARIIENNRISIERQRGEERKRERNKKRKKIRTTMAENPAQLRLKNLVAPASSLESGNKGSREKSWKTVLKTVNDTPPNSALYRKWNVGWETHSKRTASSPILPIQITASLFEKLLVIPFRFVTRIYQRMLSVFLTLFIFRFTRDP